MGSTFQNFKNLKVDAQITVGADAGTTVAVDIQFVDRDNGNEISERVQVGWYLSSDANGDVVGPATDGGIDIGTDGVIVAWLADIQGVMISEADGDVDLVVTDSAAGTWYLILVMPDGKLIPSAAITFSA